MAEGGTIEVDSDVDIVAARQFGREMATGLGFSRTDTTLIATAISEVARNITTYAGHGEIRFELVNAGGRNGMIVIAVDEGPGIADIDQAMQDGYSTGRGMGLGLPGARRLMDEFQIVSNPGEGTTVTMVKWLTTHG